MLTLRTNKAYITYDLFVYVLDQKISIVVKSKCLNCVGFYGVPMRLVNSDLSMIQLFSSWINSNCSDGLFGTYILRNETFCPFILTVMRTILSELLLKEYCTV